MTDTAAARLRAALSDVEYMLLEQGLRADAAYVAGLVKEGREDAVREYMTRSNYVDRLDAWKRGRR